MGEQVEGDADIVTLLKDLVYGEHINLKAAEEIESFRKQCNHLNRRYWDLVKDMDALKEQLAMAKTEAKDLTEFRDRDRKTADNIVLGMGLAIEAMARGMKGGK